MGSGGSEAQRARREAALRAATARQQKVQAQTRSEAASSEERRPLRQSGGGMMEEGGSRQERSTPEPSAPPAPASARGGGDLEDRLVELQVCADAAVCPRAVPPSRADAVRGGVLCCVQRMGFVEEDARRALALCGGDLSAAIDMLS